MANTLTIKNPDYRYNGNNTLVASFIYIAEQQADGSFTYGPLVHSSKLNEGDFIWWPQEDGSMEVERVEHAQVHQNNDDCCKMISVEIGFPPHLSCQVKYCCGEGCCCQ